jgi:GTP cyclohydrolase II
MGIEKSNIANLPTKHGIFKIRAYKDKTQEHLLIMSPNLQDLEYPLVRIHSECLTGDALSSLKCDCQEQLNLALKVVGINGGLVIYHRQEGRNIGLLNKVNAYALQDKGRDTILANVELGFESDERDYSIVKNIIEDLKLKKIRLITNNPKKIEYVESIGVEIVERIPSLTEVNKYNRDYLDTKKNNMGHLL